MAIWERMKGFFKQSAPTGELPLSRNQSRVVARYGNGKLTSLITTRLPSSNRDWAKESGDLGLNGIVAIGIDWYVRNWGLSKPVIRRNTPNTSADKYEIIDEHPCLNVIKNPYPNIPASRWWGWIIQDYKILGNAYARIMPIRGAKDGEQKYYLQYLPGDMVSPEGSQTTTTENFVYTVDGRRFIIPSEEIIHWAYLRDPKDIRLGRAQLSAVLKEIATDNQSSTTAYALVRNNAMPSLMVGPSPGDMVEMSVDDARAMKEKLSEDFTSDYAGGIAVMTAPYNVSRLSMSPSEMNLDGLRRKPEERISAALGLNCMVLSLGAGLERNTYSNYAEARKAAWEDGMVPLQQQLADVLTLKVLSLFPDIQDGDVIAFDNSNVNALDEDNTTKVARSTSLYESGIIDRAEARKIVGELVQPQDAEVFHAKGVGMVGGVMTAAPPVKTTEVKSDELEIDEELKLVQYEIRSVDSFIPTSAMANAAKRAIAWREQGNPGATRVGWARANQLVNRENLTSDTVMRMYSFFSRHEVDKQAEGFNEGEEGFPSKGRVAWDAWGGDEGFAWSRRMRNRILAKKSEDMVSTDDGLSTKSFHSPLYSSAKQLQRDVLRQEQGVVESASQAWSKAFSSSQKMALELNDGMTKSQATALCKKHIAAIETFTETVIELAEAGQFSVAETSSEEVKDMALLQNPDTEWVDVDSYDISDLSGVASNGESIASMINTVSSTFKKSIDDALETSDQAYVMAVLNGIRMNAFNQYENIVRNEMLHASRAGAMMAYAKNKANVLGYKRVCSADVKTSAVCWGMHGVVSPLTQHPHVHPRCRCVTVPVVDGSLDTDIPTSEQLFMGLSPDERKSTLGKTRYEFWESGTPLSSFATTYMDDTWGNVARLIPLNELVVSS